MRQLGLLLILLGASLFLWRQIDQSQQHDAAIQQAQAVVEVKAAAEAVPTLPNELATDAKEKSWRYEGIYGRKKIKDIKLGDRVIARNPEVNELQRLMFEEPDRSWKQIKLSMIKPDGTQVIVSLLRPQSWMAQQDAKIGGKIHLVLEELGLDGDADVLAIDDAPKIKEGEGQVVTGTFHHQAGNVLDIAVEGLEGSIGTTSNHPFWSEDRQAFVQAGELKVGEQLRKVDGSLALIGSVSSRGPPEQVFNLEVAGEHVYFVSDAGVLVHNEYPTIKGKLSSQQVNELADPYLGVILKGAYTKADLEKALGYSLTESQKKSIRNYLKSEAFHDVTVNQVGTRKFVDFGPHAKQGQYSISRRHLQKMEDAARNRHPADAKKREMFARRLHEKYLANKYGLTKKDLKGLTWHHMGEVGQFQAVPTGIHKFFSKHDGYVTWVVDGKIIK